METADSSFSTLPALQTQHERVKAPTKTQAGDELVLQKALEKLVRFGEDVGISPDEMIGLLESGMTIPELLRYVASKAGVA